MFRKRSWTFTLGNQYMGTDDSTSLTLLYCLISLEYNQTVISCYSMHGNAETYNGFCKHLYIPSFFVLWFVKWVIPKTTRFAAFQIISRVCTNTTAIREFGSHVGTTDVIWLVNSVWYKLLRRCSRPDRGTSVHGSTLARKHKSL